MFKPITPSEWLLFSTVRIITECPEGNGVGTGFFFRFRLDSDRYIVVLITNKHVVENASHGRFSLHQASNLHSDTPDGNFLIEINNFEAQWIHHPNPDVDLCGFVVGPIIESQTQQGKPAFYTVLEESQIWSDSKLEELTAIADVLMIGYPTGLWDYKNNFPLIRRGITSTHPAMDFCGMAQGLIDMACFQGSSGSPVLVVNEGMYPTKPVAASLPMPLVAGNRVILLGVLFGFPTMKAEGNITIEPIPTNVRHPVIETKVPIHLGYYIKAKEILELGKTIVQRLGTSGV